MTTYDLWVRRDTKIKKTEWHELVARNSNLHIPNASFGSIPEGASSKEGLSEFVWWHRSNSLPVRISFIAGAIHIEAGDAAAWDFASVLAAQIQGELNG